MHFLMLLLVLSTYVATYTVDNTAPVITNVVAVPNVNGTAVITWNTNEASDSRVDYGTTSGNLNLNTSDDNILVTSHTITLTGLTPGATYYLPCNIKRFCR